jgi:acyl-CoA hydrolase
MHIMRFMYFTYTGLFYTMDGMKEGNGMKAVSEWIPSPSAKPASASYTIKAAIVLPPDTNHHGTIFGGKLMAYIDDVATIAATRHARLPVVTASTDSVDFLQPVKKGDAVCLSAFVTWANKTSMEIFVRVVTEDLLSGERKVCATSFLTFVALDEDGRPAEVPGVIPETAEERKLYDTARLRKDARKIRRQESKEFAEYLGADYRLGREKTNNVYPLSKRSEAKQREQSPSASEAAAPTGEADVMNEIRNQRNEAFASVWDSEW